MTPAEKPSDRERNDVLVRLAKKAMALPMPVDIPANSVRRMEQILVVTWL